MDSQEDHPFKNASKSFFFFLLYFALQYCIGFCHTVFLPFIDMNQPRVYMSSQSWTPLPPPTSKIVPIHSFLRSKWLGAWNTNCSLINKCLRVCRLTLVDWDAIVLGWGDADWLQSPFSALFLFVALITCSIRQVHKIAQNKWPGF